MRNVAPNADLTTPAVPTPEDVVPAFANGSLIDGKYLVEETLAEGGIGVVIAARHLALDQRVAIKYLKPEARANRAVLERFVREGRLAAQISSDHVVRVHDVGVLPEGGPYIVMEYLVGEDLGRVVRRGPIPVKQAVDYALQACEALAAAHALRIVHRDIKPENLFLAERPSNTPIIKVVDFGISKVAPQRDHEGQWAHETAAGERFGTPLYMSPEQLRSSSTVDPRTDVWSLGVTLHELVTGSLPFEGNDLPQLCTSVLTGAPIPLTEARRDAPALLEAVILRCLEKNPDLRFQNLAELARELAAFGPPDASTRVARIENVIRQAGEAVRPSRPTPETIEIRPSLIAASLASGGHAKITGAEAATVVSSRVNRRPEGRRRAFGWVVGGACITAIGALAFVDRSPAPRGAAAFKSVASVAEAPRTGPIVETARVDATQADNAAAAAPRATASVAPPASAPVRVKVAPSKTAPPAADPRRSLFGDRK